MFKSILPAAAIAFALIFFGAPASKASGQVAFQAQFATPVGAVGVAAGPGVASVGYHGHGGHGGYYGHGHSGHGYYGHGYARPYYGGAYYAPGPYRYQRVFIALPFPHWIWQPIYVSSPYPAPAYGYPNGAYGYPNSGPDYR